MVVVVDASVVVTLLLPNRLATRDSVNLFHGFMVGQEGLIVPGRNRE